MRKSEYIRVVPRDLFNESKLLKCLGALYIASESTGDRVQIDIEHDGKAFDVQQDPADGSIYVANVGVYINRVPHAAWCPMNSRDAYPLYLMSLDDNAAEPFAAFDDDGNLSSTFPGL